MTYLKKLAWLAVGTNFLSSHLGVLTAATREREGGGRGEWDINFLLARQSRLVGDMSGWKLLFDLLREGGTCRMLCWL